MLISVGQYSVLNILEVYSCVITHGTPKIKKTMVDGGFLGLYIFPTYTTTEIETFEVRLVYKAGDGTRTVHTMPCDDLGTAEDILKNLIKQLKNADAALVTAALEQALFGVSEI